MPSTVIAVGVDIFEKNSTKFMTGFGNDVFVKNSGNAINRHSVVGFIRKFLTETCFLSPLIINIPRVQPIRFIMTLITAL